MSRTPQQRFIEITAKTAKCDKCEQKNKATLYRCITSGHQLCTPCREKGHCHDLHGILQDQTGAPQSSAFSESSPESPSTTNDISKSQVHIQRQEQSRQWALVGGTGSEEDYDYMRRAPQMGRSQASLPGTTQTLGRRVTRASTKCTSSASPLQNVIYTAPEKDNVTRPSTRTMQNTAASVQENLRRAPSQGSLEAVSALLSLASGAAKRGGPTVTPDLTTQEARMEVSDSRRRSQSPLFFEDEDSAGPKIALGDNPFYRDHSSTNN
ncbi:hypothetical protein MMC09_001653 [Bachmanniomyces sp. S44760]|nr:hypothetical protein [Bachmanniomyces sp. S44760]